MENFALRPRFSMETTGRRRLRIFRAIWRTSGTSVDVGRGNQEEDRCEQENCDDV